MVYEMNTIGKSAFWLGVARLSSGLKLGEEPFWSHSKDLYRSTPPSAAVYLCYPHNAHTHGMRLHKYVIEIM